MPAQKITIEAVGSAPLILHNGNLVNRHYWAARDLKRLSSIRKKTDADLDEMAKVEWYGGLYLNKDKKIVIPRFMQDACLIEGAKKIKLGKQAKAGLMALEDVIIDIGKDLSIDELWNLDEHKLYRPVKIGMSKVMRMRPIFPVWKISMQLQYLDELLDQKQIIQMAENAGMQCGLGDWRPQHGRFCVNTSCNL